MAATARGQARPAHQPADASLIVGITGDLAEVMAWQHPWTAA
jgi:hypothetical protein